ncbi:hypothetical protein [Pedobacter sp. MW01-1-1]|uniref:hypothetical protein n=1 Tax=Pedobacter sp. MW01-1-1 TaxID=3383027 RepID=UPI003FEE0FB6
MKFFICLLFIPAIISCNKKYVIYNAVKGNLLSSNNHKPIKDAKIYVAKFSSNNFDTIRTSANGSFFIDGLELTRKYLNEQLNLSYEYNIEKHGFKKKTIIIKNLKETSKNKLDTIDLGNIYLEKEY